MTVDELPELALQVTIGPLAERVIDLGATLCRFVPVMARGLLTVSVCWPSTPRHTPILATLSLERPSAGGAYVTNVLDVHFSIAVGEERRARFRSRLVGMLVREAFTALLVEAFGEQKGLAVGAAMLVSDGAAASAMRDLMEWSR